MFLAEMSLKPPQPTLILTDKSLDFGAILEYNVPKSTKLFSRENCPGRSGGFLDITTL
jgi:hypothetical protein